MANAELASLLYTSPKRPLYCNNIKFKLDSARRSVNSETESPSCSSSLPFFFLFSLLYPPQHREGLGHCPKQAHGSGARLWQDPTTASTMAPADRLSNHWSPQSTILYKHTPLSANVPASSLLASTVRPPSPSIGQDGLYIEGVTAPLPWSSPLCESEPTHPQSDATCLVD